MLRAANSSEPIGAGAGPFGAEFQAAVRAELEAMLVTPIFVQSGRCKRFLNYIVEQTLSGHAGQLKERTIGIDVFERANDYDTGDDSIVRVTANEVRKRIGQFYQESPKPHLVQIDLPRGSYVPEFRIQPSRQVGIQPSQQVERPAVFIDAGTSPCWLRMRSPCPQMPQGSPSRLLVRNRSWASVNPGVRRLTGECCIRSSLF